MAVSEREPQSGQAIVEYLILLAVVVSSYVLVARWVKQFGLAQKLTRPITEDFAKAYQFGDTQAEGFENGGPRRHPRAVGGEGNFRIFINPKIL